MRPNPVKRALQAGQPSVGTWLSLGSPMASRFMARSGLAWLTIDMEHGAVDWETTTIMMALIAEAGCTPLVRVPANRHDHIKRALDNGAMGIVVPMVNSREEAVAAVAATKYPPAGNRSVGGAQHALNYDTTANDYYAHANNEILVVLQCEHITSAENFDDIFSVPGIDAVFVGPNDLAASMRSKDGKPPSGEATTQVMKRILEGARRNKVAPGIHCGSPEEARLRIEEGWQFLAVASELRMLLDAVGTVVKKLGGQQAGEVAKY